MKRFAALLLLVSCAHWADRDFIQGPQGRLHIDDGGSGSAVPIVFVHGNGANLTQWRAQLDHERESRRAIAFDLRGMGRSEPPRNGDYSVAAMADDVDAVTGALRLQRFILVGHSYGGAVVAAVAARHPERVAGVVFADSAGNVKISDDAAANFERALRNDKDKVVQQWFGPILKPSSEAVREEVYASVHATPIDAFVGALNGMRSIDMNALLAAYPGPKIAIVAADIEGPSSFRNQFPAIPARTLSGTGHWLMLDEPVAFNTLLDDALQTIDAVGKQNVK